MNYGSLENKGTFFVGHIRNELIDIEVVFEKNRNKVAGDSKPDFVVYTKSPAGNRVSVGGAWKKVAKAEKHAGKPFLSISIKLMSLETERNPEGKISLSAYDSDTISGFLDVVYNSKK